MSNSLKGLYSVPKTGKFAGQVLIAVDYTDTKVTLLDVHSNRKVTMNRCNVLRYKHNGNFYQCKTVVYRDTEYLVTLKGLIISCKTNRVMKWSEDDGNRCAIKTKAYLEATLSVS